MPFYEYQCRKCGERFEALRRIRDDDREVECPHCHEKAAERRISLTVSEILRSGNCGTGRGPTRFG